MQIETTHAIRRLIDEHKRLRRDNEILHAQMEVVRIFGAIVLPRIEAGMSVDPVWEVENALFTEAKASQNRVAASAK